MAVTIVNAGYSSTNYWVISAGRSRLLVDLGYPGTLGTMRATLKRLDVPLDEIRYALATHYHIDHAGLAQEIHRAIRGPGEARPDGRILWDLADRRGLFNVPLLRKEMAEIIPALAPLAAGKLGEYGVKLRD